MFWSCGALLGGCVGNAITNSFFAQGDTKTPTKVAMGGLTLGIILKAIGCYVGGINGMAIADTITTLSACTVLGLILYKRLQRYLANDEPAFTAQANSHGVSAGV
jgi:peptidoglycan biosynthesis protein MviN/MurJ (putative lipid II flippase)